MSVNDQIRSQLDIVQYIQSSGVPLQRRGRYFVAPCPFHAEKTPSFVVFPESQHWHCFGACAEGGDIFTFAMKKERLTFPEARRALAKLAGIELEERSADERQQASYLDKLRGLMRAAADYFHAQLTQNHAGADALAYARNRGLTDETIRKFHIGYAPNGWQNAQNHLTQLGYSLAELMDVGILTQNDAGQAYDRFRNRLMIPICDERGNVIGFGARALAAHDQPKYLNSPQSPLFDKSSTLFALNHARRAIREGEVAVIVEGYLDAISAHQAGFENVVAQMGTALTPQQLKALSRYAQRLILALDPDAAGVRATLRGLDVVRQASDAEGGRTVFLDAKSAMRDASRLNVELQVITVPDGKDPDDLIRQSPETWRELVTNAQDMASYVIMAGTADLPPNASLLEREERAKKLLPLLTATENSLQRHANVQQLAYKLRLGSGKAMAEWALALQASQKNPLSTPKPQRDAQRAAFNNERFCLATLLQRPALLADVQRRLRELASQYPAAGMALSPLSADDFTHADHRLIFEAFERARDQLDEDWYEALRRQLPPELHRDLDQLEQIWFNLNEAHSKNKTSLTKHGEGGYLEALIRCAVELRQARLQRETDDLMIMLQESAQGMGGDMEALAHQHLLMRKQASRALQTITRPPTLVQQANPAGRITSDIDSA
ncbi:MAG: DNA primase [Anaerolineae bacterium]